MPGHDFFVSLHVAAGTLALVTFWIAASLRKGSPRHRLVGRVYLLAMLAVIVTALPLVTQRALDGNLAGASFLGYLVVLVSTTVWLAWRAIRDKQQPARYLGGVYQVLAVINPLAGLWVLGVGVWYGQPLLIGFSLIGVVVGVDMFRRRRVIPTQPRWWIEEHYGAMLGNGAATHIAFFALGLPRLLPAVSGSALFYAAWFVPVLLSIAAKVWLDRKYRIVVPTKTPQVAPARAAHSTQ